MIGNKTTSVNNNTKHLKTVFITLFLTIVALTSFAQERKLSKGKKFEEFSKTRGRDSLNNGGDYNRANEIKVELDGKTHFTDYKLISYKNDTTYIDTTLTIRKDYKFNYIRKDDFELVPFHNLGQTYTNLAYNFSEKSMLPKMGARAKFFNFKEVKDIYYYNVPTPTSELMYRSAMEQGQVLDVFLTLNTSPKFNFSVAYKGLRSNGKYINSGTSFGNFNSTFNYNTKNKKYFLRGHYVTHDFLNKENGGLTNQSIIYFETNDENYIDRNRLEVNYDNAENMLISKRYHFEHFYKFGRKKDSVKNHETNLKIGHKYTYETKLYRFTQEKEDTIIGVAFQNSINDITRLKTLNNLVYVELESPLILGKIRAKASQYNFNHFYSGIVNLTNATINSQLKGNTIAAGADWNANYKNFILKADINTIIAGDLKGSNLIGTATYKKDSLFNVSAKLELVSKSPNFNFLHNQSDYIAYNWQNNSFKNEEIRNLSFQFKADKWNLNASASITQIDNYTYFNEDAKPLQANETVNYLKIKASKSFSYKKFTLANTVMYQKVANGETVFRVPNFITRNSIYYSNYLFKNKPLYLQTGFTFKYFSKYKMNAYNPLLAEFTLQNTREYGDYPMVNFFANGQVRRTRIYLKVENITASFTGRNYYAAPLNPYRDLTVRFGLVWNFFI